MPYIKKYKRQEIDGPRHCPSDVGELNYMVTQLCDDYLNHTGKHYETMNDIVGVLECAKLEFYRRIAAPYEDQKIKENGDVYDV